MDAEQYTQGELPFAIVGGEPLSAPPTDLYIPPDALEVILEAFEGPLDLLLYLIRRQNIDILEIPIAHVTRQYMEYIELMGDLRMELAAEYLLMAAMLAEIKSRMLLPRPESTEEEEDPRAELVRRLLEYEQFKQAAEDMDALPREQREIFVSEADLPELEQEKPEPDVELQELLLAFREVMQRADMFTSHHIRREQLSVRERMTSILETVKESKEFVVFHSLFTAEEGKMGAVVTFLAVLELVKGRLLDIVQIEPFSPIHLATPQAVTEGEDGN